MANTSWAASSSSSRAIGATIANGSLAGSVSDVMACMRTAVRTMGIPLTSAVKAATVNPARALGL